jgi:hypothetical protein
VRKLMQDARAVLVQLLLTSGMVLVFQALLELAEAH